jgi:hypothetical protein
VQNGVLHQKVQFFVPLEVGPLAVVVFLSLKYFVELEPGAFLEL